MQEFIVMRNVVCMLLAVALAAAALPAAAQARHGEMRGAWMGTGYGRDWPAIMKSLHDNGFNALFPNMSTGGAAWYPSKVLPAAAGASAKRDELAEAVKAAKQYGIELHVWRIDWMLEGISEDVRAKWEAEGRLMRSADGKFVHDDPADLYKFDWLCPSNPENRKLETDAMLEVVRKYDIAGIQFDYMRYPSAKYCYCDHCRDQFQKDTGATVQSWPADVLSDGKYEKQYEQWRQGLQTSLVQEISKEAHRIKPNVKVSLAAWPVPDTARHTVLQDWPAWVKNGSLDFVAVMAYANSDQMAAWLAADEEVVGGAIPVYAGLGAFTMKSATALAQQIRAARTAGADGFIAFAYYSGDLHTWLPSLRSTVAYSDPDPMPHWSPASRFDFSGPAAAPSLTGRQVEAGALLSVDIKIGVPKDFGTSQVEEEGAAQATDILRRATDARRPLDVPDVMPMGPRAGQGDQLSGRIVLEDAQGASLAIVGGFDGGQALVRRFAFTTPQGPFRIAVYGSERREGEKEPREFVTRSPLLVGVAPAEETPAPQSEAPSPQAVHAQLVRLLTEAPGHARTEALSGTKALISIHATGEAGGDWWLRIADGKCTSGEGVVEKPDVSVSGAAEDLLALADGQVDAMSMWTSGRVAVTGDLQLLEKLCAALGITSVL